MHALSELKGFPYLGLVEGHPLSLNFINKKKGVTSTSISTHKKNKIRYTISYLKTEKNTEFPKRLPVSTEQQSHGSKDSKLSPVLVHVDPINQSNRKFKPQQERTKYPKGKKKKKIKTLYTGQNKKRGKMSNPKHTPFAEQRSALSSFLHRQNSLHPTKFQTENNAGETNNPMIAKKKKKQVLLEGSQSVATLSNSDFEKKRFF